MNSGAPIIVGLGEALWDMLPTGKQLGGAPANFAYHAHALGAQGWPVTRVGRDALGTEIIERLRGLGLPTSCVQIDPTAPTGTVSVEILPGSGHRFTIHENVAWDFIELTDEALALAARAKAICFGTLAQRCEHSRAAIQAIAAAASPEALHIFDINLRQQFYSRTGIEHSLQLANMLKMNDDELPVLAELFGIAGEPREQIAELAHRFHLQLVALTRGKNGSLLYSGGSFSDLPGSQLALVDTIGAGDAFTAAMAIGWMSGWPLDRINRSASAVASYVCTQSGATPPIPAELSALFTART